ncbi:4-hydroxy-tetrahydrodipicolinate reductase [subsurface metagenome]
MKSKLIVSGAAGRMGRRIIALAMEAGQFDIIAAIERQDHPDIGKDAGLVAAAGPINVKLDSVYPSGADVVIDFSQPAAADKKDYWLDYFSANQYKVMQDRTK